MRMESMFPKNTWEEYEALYELPEQVEEVLAIKKILDEHPELHGLTGEQLQEEFDNELYGMKIRLGWRSWGALMSAYMNSKEGERKYHYISFYM